MATYLTKSFTLEEFTRSKYKINNTPNSKQLANIRRLCEKLLQPIRDAWGSPIIIGSGFRCSELNNKVGGVKNSQHMALNGAAADLTLYRKGDTVSEKRKKNLALFEFIKELKSKGIIEFDQLLWEKGSSEGPDWVHISYKAENNRNQVLKLK